MAGNAPAATKAHVLATYAVAVSLFAYLCKQFELNSEDFVVPELPEEEGTEGGETPEGDTVPREVYEALEVRCEAAERALEALRTGITALAEKHKG